MELKMPKKLFVWEESDKVASVFIICLAASYEMIQKIS